ncbi:hypothetical protein MBLNU13_g08843t1 [Cladosporium sp. NU13]
MAYKNQPLHPQDLDTIPMDLPEWHGRPADRNRNARRRQRQKAKRALDGANKAEKAALESKINLPGPPSIPVDHAHNFIVFHVNIDQTHSRPESQQSANAPQDDQQNRAENLNQARSGAQEATAAPRRVDSFKIRDARDSSPEASSQLQNKPALSASSTSAEIVEALMPNRPAPKKMEVRDEVMAWEAERKARGV